MTFVWLNGELLDASQARISVLDRGVIWGYGLFETLRGYGGRIWAFDEHYQRLLGGSRALELPVPDAATARDAMEAVIRADGLEDCGIRFTVTLGAGPPDPHADPIEAPNAFVSAWPLRDYTELYSHGAALITLHGGGRPLGGVKSTSYAASVAGRLAARRAGADDAVFVGEGDRVLEATGSNLFAATGDTISTPPLDGNILPGVTRAFVLDVARREGFSIEERALDVSALRAADEVLLTSTLREVYPARSIDGKPLGRAGVAERLREAYRAEVLRRLA